MREFTLLHARAFRESVPPFLREALLWILGVLISMIAAGVVLLTNGNLFAVGGLLGALAVLVVTLYRIDWGLYLFVFMVLLFDQFAIPGIPSLTYRFGYFLNINAISYLPTIRAAVVNPMEVQLCALVLIWLLAGLGTGALSLTRIPLKVPFFLFFAAVAGSLVHGWLSGGDAIVSLWETRAFFYLGIMYFLVPQIIQTREQLHTLMWFCIAGISFKALQGAARFASMGFSFGWWPNIIETFTNHEDPVFFITLFVFLLGLVVFGAQTRQRRVLFVLLPVLLLGFVAAQRRATYASLMATLFAFIVLLPPKSRSKILSVAAVVLVTFGLYLAIFWTSYSRLGVIAQQFKATVIQTGSIRGEKDKLSTLYREQENYNLSQTFRRSPIAGIGFGKSYDKPIHLWGSDFALGEFLPHNQILWIFVKMGIVGGFCFWLLFNSHVFRSAVLFHRIKDPYLRALCAVSVVAVINQVVVSYVDMQLAWYRNMVYLGILMSVAPMIERFEDLSRHGSKGSAAHDSTTVAI